MQHWLGHFLQKVNALWFSRISEVSSFGTEIDYRRNLFGRGMILGPLHMSPVDRAGSVTEMKLVSVHMVTFSPLSEMKNLKKW